MQIESQGLMASRVNVGPMERGVSLFAGLALFAHAFSRRRKWSLPLVLDAGYLLYRGVTGHCAFYQLLGIRRTEVDGHEGIRVEQSVTVNRPRAELFQAWRDVENLPRFMAHLEAVRVDESDPDRSHWVAKGPLDRRIEWDSEIIEERENELLVWKSLPGSLVESMGRVEFRDAPAGDGTLVHVSMEYNPPGGSLGAAFARLFGEEPDQQVREDLRRFKQMMETGEAATGRSQPPGSPEPEVDKDIVEMASEDSFPASDPPGWISERGIR